MEYIALYIETGLLLFCSLIVIWTSLSITKFKRFMNKRDEIYLNRILSIETLVKKEFKDLLHILKKHQDDSKTVD